jgi:RNA polymerase sigma factor (sigma-70 family)
MTTKNNPISNTGIDSRIESDQKLVREICGGSVHAWHEFLNRYSGLIHSVVRRHLLSVDEDEVRTVYVDILKLLYDGEIKRYRGDALLSSWLIVTTRNRSLDFFRKRYGRLHTPTGYAQLNEFDKKVLRLYFVARLPLEIVVNVLGWNGLSTETDDIVGSIQRIETTMDRRYLKRLDAEHQARKFRADSVHVLKYVLQLRVESEEKSAANRSDHRLLEEEILKKADRLRAALAGLTSEEKHIVSLRFERGLSARKITEELSLKSQRRAYWLIDKVVKKLREAMLAGGDRQ